MVRQEHVKEQSCGRLILVAAVAGALAAWTVGFKPQVTAAVASGPAAGAAGKAREAWPWQGVNSCAATACHGDSGPKGSKRSEYTTWFTYDKHARAYGVLLTDRSRLIEKNYRRHRDPKDAHPETDFICLKCHAVDAPEHTSEMSLSDGVACESCHGPAEKWLTVHYLPGFKEKSDREKYELYGMQPTKNLFYRAQMCAECHVGSPGKEVDHDLYAAGHPPLHFEFGAYLGLMPKHWSEQEEKNRHPDLEVKTWALGQVVSARAAFDLLAWRAESPSRPWPELAEYGCYACHHDLQATSRRQEPRHLAGRAPGALPWGSWFTTNLLLALDQKAAPNERVKLQQELTRTKKAMTSPLPDRSAVAKWARSMAGQLEQFGTKLESVQFDSIWANRMMRSLKEREPMLDPADWDEQAQVYLALAALYHGLGDLDPSQRDPALKDELSAMRNRLAFPAGFDSPRGFDAKFPGEPLESNRR